MIYVIFTKTFCTPYISSYTLPLLYNFQKKTDPSFPSITRFDHQPVDKVLNLPDKGSCLRKSCHPPKCHFSPQRNKGRLQNSLLDTGFCFKKKWGPGFFCSKNILFSPIWMVVISMVMNETSMGSPNPWTKITNNKNKSKALKRTALRNNDGWLQTPSIIRVENCLGGIGISSP